MDHDEDFKSYQPVPEEPACHSSQHEEGPIHQRSKQVEGFIGEELPMEMQD